MRAVLMRGPGDVRVEDREDPRIIELTDAVTRLTATGICGSNRWSNRGPETIDALVTHHQIAAGVALPVDGGYVA